MFSREDLDQIRSKQMDLAGIQKQIDHFAAGFPFIRLARPATVNDGIIKFDAAEVMHYTEFFERKSAELKTVKFVPASGAASRMFKHLFEFSEKYTPSTEGQSLFQSDQGFNSVFYFISHIKETAFFNDLSEIIADSGGTVEGLIQSGDYGTLIEAILSPSGLNYAGLPKALLKFHQYPEGSRTAAEEHMVEAAEYAKDGAGMARLHFTISPEHREKFMELLDRVQKSYQSRFGIRYGISFSIQKPSTDTIAVDENNEPVRNPDGSLLFRPGGHGALLDNLSDVEGDLIFIKNIDNIVPDRLKSHTIQYKKLLGGYLLFLRENISAFLARLNEGEASPGDIREIKEFAVKKLFLDIPADFDSYSHASRSAFLLKILDKPVRVCGMVKNEGEPGGGPFWVHDDDGRLSLQIVESSQIDPNDHQQKNILERSTHFNPVDLACSTRNFKGGQFNLKEYVDENTGFISLKSSGGRTLKAQELPGLWNGAMARWITIFVETPAITFNPVKTVNDLLRNEHLTK